MSWMFLKYLRLNRLKVSFALSTLAVAFLPVVTMSQAIVDGRIVYPPEFNPLVTSRPRPPEVPLVPETKFVKAKNPIPGHYIVVLNDDVVTDDVALDERLKLITSIANRHAKTYGGTIFFIYHAALKGYSIELPTEAAAIALSEDPEVRWVEEDAIGEFAGAPAIVSIGAVNNPSCTYNATRPDQKGSKSYLAPRHPH